MIQINPGEYASQGNVFSQISLQRYVKKNSRLKFWKIKDLKNWERHKLYGMINADLRLPWWKRMYDYAGILGQIIGIKKFNNPWKMYCSERVAKYLREILEDIPEHPSPADLNEIFKKHPRMEVYGRWGD